MPVRPKDTLCLLNESECCVVHRTGGTGNEQYLLLPDGKRLDLTRCRFLW